MSTSIPSWAQEIIVIVVACLSILIAGYKYVTTQITTTAAKDNSTPIVVETKIIKELIDALREHSEEDARIAQRSCRAMAELREALLDNVEASRTQSEAISTLSRTINKHHIGGDN